MIHVISHPSYAALNVMQAGDIVILKHGEIEKSDVVSILGGSKEPWISNTLLQLTSPHYLEILLGNFFSTPRIDITVHTLPEEFSPILNFWREKRKNPTNPQDFKLFFTSIC